jgi:outer membrane protein W
VGYFRPADHLIREIYPRGVALEVQLRRQLVPYIEGWVNANYFVKRGQSLGLHEKTRLQILPLSIGLNVHRCIAEKFTPYIGLGATYTMLKTFDQASSLTKRHHRYRFGGVAKSGILYSVNQEFFFSAFADYYYTKVSNGHGNIDIGGLRTGLGLGFNL